MKENPLVRLHSFGQSVWLDLLSRQLLESGELQRLIEQDGLRGLTSNPAIFEKAIGGSSDYDEDFFRLLAAGKTLSEIYQALTVDDIQRATDLFRPLFDQTRGGDGFVSLEVSPHLAYDTMGSIDEALRLWTAVKRPNVMIKVPGTRQGLKAIQHLIRDGVNVNVTLLFGLERYREVADAYLSGLEERANAGEPLGSVRSVASFFLSRIDVLLDPKLKEIAASGSEHAETAKSLVGEIAIANAKMAYQIYKEVFSSGRFEKLRAQGAHTQRLLWGSTGTKNPDYSDVKYVEPLIGADTVNTMPEETLEAYRDHGDPAPRLEKGVAEARRHLDHLKKIGIDLRAATQKLEEEGVEKFIKPFDKLMEEMESKASAGAGKRQS